MYPSYSPLFKLGLLAEHAPPRSTTPISTLYFTLDTAELRSFLSLDLADNKPYLPSHRPKLSVLSKSTSWVDMKSLARTEKASPAPVALARRRTSKESLRSIPSPKPAPSTTLPDLPITTDPPSSSEKRPAPTVLTSSSSRSESISSHDRRKSRRHALARLEGRSASRVLRPTSLRNNFMSFSDDEEEGPAARKSRRAPPPAVQVEDLSAFADVEDELEAVAPPSPARGRENAGPAENARSAKLGRKRRSTLESWFPLKSFIDLKDDDLSSWNWRSFIEIGGVA